MTQQEQFQRLRAWLLREVGFPEIIPAHDQGPRPVGPYATLNLIRVERINWPDDEETPERDPGTAETDGESFDQVMVEEWECTWSLNAYGSSGASILARCTSASKSSAALDRLHPLALHSTSGIRRIPELVGERWEDRAQIDLNIRVMQRTGFATDAIESVPLDVRSQFAPPSTGD